MTKTTLGGMAFCKHTGKPLPKHLYNDPKGRAGVYRYRRPDGSFKTVHLPYARAVEAARKANAQREAPEGSLVYWVEQYKAWAVSNEPGKTAKRGWVERQRQLENFARDWNQLHPLQLNVGTLSDWWDSLTYDQQHNRRAHFSAFFVWALGRGVVRSNPFSRYDNVARLIQKQKPAKRRAALSLEDFWQIHDRAAPHVQIAMVISLTTTMREGDIVGLRFEDIEDGYLQRTIKKSVSQRGATAAAHLKWRLEEHAELKAAIDRARELSMRHRRCPYIVSRPRQRTKELAAGLTHPSQCLPAHLSRGFKKARDATERWPVDGPTFHEIRGLGITMLLRQGLDIGAVQRLAAHTDPSITSAYTAGQAPHFLDMAGLVVPIR